MFELPKVYDPKEVEGKWYPFWEKEALFQADPQSPKPPYCIVIPPPNVTGVLHMGHALVDTLQDILIRWKRMNGFNALWVPGTDHAGISTQTVVERHLMNTTGKRRKDFSREDFLAHVWRWKEDSESRIVNQIKRLGCSCDWTRQRFTMDERNNRAVRTMFKKMFNDGLIYRGDYLVNWDPVTQTALADDEVEYEERQSFLWHFRYPLADGSGHVEIATTRPETMLGDTAVAVAPQDPRYSALIGKKLLLPLVDREIPIIADHHVDPEFGTGAVKVTPAHDPNDYQIGLRHDLPFVNIMTPDGQVNEAGGPFAGLSFAEAREGVVNAMKERGLLAKVEPHVNRVGISYRSKATIEPYLSKQWFIRMEGFRPKLRAAVTEERVRLIPKNWENTYFHWIDNLRDWCISRQLWWGHRIPIWYHKEDPERMICFDGEDAPPEVVANPDQWVQDEDVLDTWFSSSLWPFAALGWPEQTPELKRFYPTSVLVTGHDILFFWVARMILMGEYAMGEVPFPETFLHGLIYGKSYWRENPGGGITYASAEERVAWDLGQPVPKGVKSKWEKMSKSKGNIIDPLELIDQYGTDAVRMALCASSPQLREIDLDRRRFEEFKNFANKVWNGARFVFMNLEGDEAKGLLALDSETLSQGLREECLKLEDHWILSVLNRTTREVNEALEGYLFDQAALKAYDFFWKEFCAYYVEISKPVLFGKEGTPEERTNKQKLLTIILCHAMRLMHPMAPFITEEIFQLLQRRFPYVEERVGQDPYTAECCEALRAQACMVAAFPDVVRESDIRPEEEASFQLLCEIIYSVRNIRGEMKIPPGTATDVIVVAKGDQKEVIRQNLALVASLIKVNQLEVQEEEPTLPFASTGVIGNLKIIIPLPQELQEQERQRLSKEREKTAKNLEKLEAQLANPEFKEKAPAPLIEKQEALLDQTKRELEALDEKLIGLNP